MKKPLALIVCFFVLNMLYGQNKKSFWVDVAESDITVAKRAPIDHALFQYRALSFNMEHLKAFLINAPAEDVRQTKNDGLILELPMPDGSVEAFSIYESSVFMPGLAAKYPEIKSFKAVSLKHKGSGGRLDYSPQGFHAALRTPKGEVFFEPYADNQDRYHVSYYGREVDPTAQESTFSCGVETLSNKQHILEAFHSENRSEIKLPQAKSANETVSLRTYRLALACTSSYARDNGGTKSSVLASMNTVINLVNAITEKEAAFRFQIIDNNDTLIYLDPDTEPYANIDDVFSLLDQNTNIITQVAKVSGASFDVGHVFTGNCTGATVGVARLKSACTSEKAKGVTCFRGNLQFIVRNILTHELGHQFSALHSWNNCPAFIEQRASASAYEPGSGSTIMSYGGSCGPQNIQFNADEYFHTISLQEIFAFSREGQGGTCPETIETSNIQPVVTLDYEDNFFIPIGTPFELKASATDANDDSLTYCWEQFDLGPIADLGNPSGDSPIFRSFPPSPDSKRVFPNLTTILSNRTDNTEQLPDYSRNLRFRCTVRDNNPVAGGVVWEEVRFKTTSSAGPFLLTHPNTADVEWKVGDAMEVTWDVANTDNSLVKCKNVNIWLSTDGGLTYTYLLAENASNDGSEMITVPDITTQNARIRIEAANNIFFDVSNANFEIWPATQAGFAFTSAPSAQEVCLPDGLSVRLGTTSILNFNNPVTMEVVEGLPEGATYSFSANPIRPNDTATLNLELKDVDQGGVFDVKIRAVAEGIDTSFRTLTLTLFSTDFSDQSLNNPPEGTNGIGLTTDFDWSPSVNALSYDFELSNTPTFDSVITSAEGITINRFSPDNLRLEENTIHYWRIRPENECGDADFSAPATFRTETVSCQEIKSVNVPVLISGTGRPTVESVIEVAGDGIISDVNIPLIKGSYQPVNSLRITLISPAGTEVILFNKNCGTTQNILMGFDDEAPEELACPPDDGIVFKPGNPLSVFNGENAKGTWILRFQVVEAGFGGGGAIDNWTLEFCGTLSPQNPFLVNNEALDLPPSFGDLITTNDLKVEDTDNTADELTFILLRAPLKGQLKRDGVPQKIGDTFTQADIDEGRMTYNHLGTVEEVDNFLFIVDDGTGGWLSTQQFNIEIKAGAVSSTWDLSVGDDLRLYPNPTTGKIWIELPEEMSREIRLRLYNLQGRLLLQEELNSPADLITQDVSGLSAGVYVVTLQSETAVRTGKVILQR